MDSLTDDLVSFFKQAYGKLERTYGKTEWLLIEI